LADGYISLGQAALIGIAHNYLREQYGFTPPISRFLYGAKYEFYHLRRIPRAEVSALLIIYEEKYTYSQDATQEWFANKQQ
jgi:hypothetical protein